MLSDAKSLRISDIQIDVRAEEGKACNALLHALGGQRRFFEIIAESNPGEHLFAARDEFDGGIQKLARDLHSRQALLLDQMAERLLHFGVQGVGQFMGVIAVRRLVDEGF